MVVVKRTLELIERCSKKKTILFVNLLALIAQEKPKENEAANGILEQKKQSHVQRHSPGVPKASIAPKTLSEQKSIVKEILSAKKDEHNVESVNASDWKRATFSGPPSHVRENSVR